MKRAVLFSSVAFVLAGVSVPVSAAPAADSVDKVMSECGSNVPPELIDTCLERARVLDEADPSPALESLEARLQQQAQVGGKPSRGYAAAPPSDSSGMPPPDNGADTYGSGSYGGSHSASGSPRDIAPGRPHALPPAQGYDSSGARNGAPRDSDAPPPDSSSRYAAPPDADMPPDNGPPDSGPPDSGAPPDRSSPDNGPYRDAPPDYGPGDQAPPDGDMPPPRDRDVHPYNPHAQESDSYDRGPPDDEDSVPPDARGPRDDDFTPDTPPADPGQSYPR